MILPVLFKRFCVFLLLLISMSGCLTIHNLNVKSGNSQPQQGSVAMSTMGDDVGNSDVNTPVPITQMYALESPPAFSLASTDSVYRIRPGDTLEVKFYYNSDLNETVEVRPDGRISLQLVHDVQAASLSPNELLSILTRKYAPHLKDPEIAVILRSVTPDKVFVDGQVYKAGGIELLENMSIMQSVASAGGLKDTARAGEVLLIRRNGLERPFVYLVNLAAAMDGTDMSQNVMLKSDDIVYIPKSAIANVNTWVDQYIRRNIPINVGVEAIRFK